MNEHRPHPLSPFKHIAVYQDPARMDEACYMPENADEDDAYFSHRALLEMAGGDERLCDRMFYDLDWQHPSTWLDENLREGELGECQRCGKLFIQQDPDSPTSLCYVCGGEVP